MMQQRLYPRDAVLYEVHALGKAFYCAGVNLAAIALGCAFVAERCARCRPIHPPRPQTTALDLVDGAGSCILSIRLQLSAIDLWLWLLFPTTTLSVWSVGGGDKQIPRVLFVSSRLLVAPAPILRRPVTR